MGLFKRLWTWWTAPPVAPDGPENPPDPPYLLMCLGVGALGLLLPVILLLGDAFFLAGHWAARGSLSAYYHSGMRDVFVGILVAIAPLLITYKLLVRRSEDDFWGFALAVTPENVVSIVAGIAVIGVAWFPTARPDDSTSLTPLQAALGERHVMIVHYCCAGIFILFLGIMCLIFAREEGQRSSDPLVRGYEPTRSPRFWKRFYEVAAAVILLTLVYIGVTQLLHAMAGFSFGEKYSLLVGETIVVVAFGLSWLMKGWEVFKLRASVRAKRTLLR